MTICCFPVCSAARLLLQRRVICCIARHLNRLRAFLSPFVNREAQGGIGKARVTRKAATLAGMGVLSAWRAPMKPVLAAAICLMLGSSSFSSRAQAIHQVQPVIAHPAAVHRAVLAGDTVPMLTGFGSTLALVIVK
jgi:hypothetical protein